MLGDVGKNYIMRSVAHRRTLKSNTDGDETPYLPDGFCAVRAPLGENHAAARVAVTDARSIPETGAVRLVEGESREEVRIGIDALDGSDDGHPRLGQMVGQLAVFVEAPADYNA